MNNALPLLAFLLGFCATTAQNQPQPNTELAFPRNAKVSEQIDYEKELPDDFLAGGFVISVTDFEKQYEPDDFDIPNCASVTEICKTDGIRLLALGTDPVRRNEYLIGQTHLLERDDVLTVEPDQYGMWFSTYPNEYNSYFDTHIPQIELEQAWSVIKGSSTVKVGIIDSGIDGTQTDIDGRINTTIAHSWSPNGTNPNEDEFGHGTKVAGIIGAETNNHLAVPGVDWNCELISLRVDGPSTSYIDPHDASITRPAYFELYSSVISAVEYARSYGIPILNFSGGFRYECSDLKGAIERYPGLFVCSAGNTGNDSGEHIYPNIDQKPVYPASFDCDNIIAVGAVDESDSPLDDSCVGIQSVDLFAPGNGIHTLQSNLVVPNNVTTFLYGTSAAAPIVTGAASLLLAFNPSLSASDLKAAILENVDLVADLSYKCVSGGRLNVRKAVESLSSGVISLPVSGPTTHIYSVPTQGLGGATFDALLEINAHPGTFDFESDSLVLSSYGELLDSSWDPIASDFLGSGNGSNFRFTYSFSSSGSYYLHVHGVANVGMSTLKIVATNHHTHSYTYQYINNRLHRETCTCGISEVRPHVVTIASPHTCRLCGGYAEFGLITSAPPGETSETLESFSERQS